MKMHWQHVNPVDDHAANPPAKLHNVSPALAVGTRSKCTKCKRSIYLAAPDDGPEMLKSLMRF